MVYQGMPHYYFGGTWYRPYREGYGVITPPGGLVIDGRGIRGYVATEVPIAKGAFALKTHPKRCA